MNFMITGIPTIRNEEVGRKARGARSKLSLIPSGILSGIP